MSQHQLDRLPVECSECERRFRAQHPVFDPDFGDSGRVHLQAQQAALWRAVSKVAQDDDKSVDTIAWLLMPCNKDCAVKTLEAIERNLRSELSKEAEA